MTTVVTNPVAQIVAARRRLKQVAALRAGLTLFVPALTALLLAATLAAIGARTWERWGYMLPPARLDGLRLAETILTTSTVSANTFGKLFSLPVDGQIFAQPLYVSHFTIGVRTSGYG